LIRILLTLLGAGTLAAVWLGPLPQLGRSTFFAHMTMHMGVVAVAAPLLAFAFAAGPLDPVHKAPHIFAPIPASIVELVIVWAWHMPRLHNVARHTTAGLIAEQGLFLACGLYLWISSVGGEQASGNRTAAGVFGMLFTSMHMTLLGALLSLAPRPIYRHLVESSASSAADALCRFPGDGRQFVLSPLEDQHLGGAIMLLIGGLSYLAGGLWLTAKILRHKGLRPGLQA